MSSANYRGVRALLDNPLIQEIRQVLLKGEEFGLKGCYSSAANLILSLLVEELDRPAFVVLQDEDDLSNAIDEMKVWSEQCDLYPYPFVHAQITTLEHSALLQQMKSIRAMLEPDAKQGIWITTLKALEAPCFSLDFIDEPVMTFEEGQSYKSDELYAALEKRGFNREDKVDQRGDYSVRGGIVDLFPRFSTHPVRVEFFGNEIETIREFSLVTQKSIRRLSRFVLDDIEYEKIDHMERAGSILDFIPSGSLFFVQEPELSGREVDSHAIRSGISELLLKAEVEPRKSLGFQKIEYARNIEDARFSFNTTIEEQDALSVPEAIAEVTKRCQGKEFFLVEEYGSKLKLAEMGKLDVWSLEGTLEYNFFISELNAEAVHEKNLVQISDLHEQQNVDSMADFIELEMGDYIVHENYGIGQFLGLTSLEKQGVMSDFLLLQFAGGSKVYVPVSQLHMVQKYLGKGESAPELSKIGSKSWEMKKKRARKAIDRIVMELVQRQAYREKQVGFSFSTDSKEQRTFERAFPYTETPCQLRASANIKKEMEHLKPMDHLLCGDVGFGKTEIAMRIAHKAIMDDKQVAVLAPTTVLAEQHYNNFCERYKDKAHMIGALNRFRKAKETRDVLSRILSGEMKVIIGTHRMLSKDVEFSNLGLLILDEEQRFGVKQKEAMKVKYPSIDILSLSATPVPRTLHMSMLGIRGISNLTIAPENRHPIRTYIRERQLGIIKHAIGRELARGGQSYFLHNRIEDIEQVRDELHKLFPKARIGIGHGQMSENELSTVMKSFYALEIDIFLSTSIIANGIDIPTANTMIINDSHMFGLSELHQIRGRIGRYSIQAYCYLLIPPGKKLPQGSMRRLRAVEEHQELGAGFKLAMKDMEIRGVGNILGEDQHGQIADIGYELYTQYLSQAIAEMQGKSPEAFIETELSWSAGSTYFPKGFIPSHSERIEFYRRISFSKNCKQLDAIQIELKDRFGKIPQPAQNLLDLFYCKINLRQLGMKSLKKKDGGENALIETLNWDDERKLAWVLANPNELAFYGESGIILKTEMIWNLTHDEQVKADPYMQHSYYNESDRPEPLDVLKVLVNYIQSSLRKLQEEPVEAS
ncbi:MAG: transcription-repair coupling factor [Planctomycetes bacterium]|nr:transcription-repair coupling factor [Planctomycetota bacterium]